MTTTIPKQTQISLNYWNASTAVDGCEFETVLQEPMIINTGDSIIVRNSSLDTSKLSNSNIFLEEDVYLTFEWMTYAMMKKATMDLQNAANDGSFHDAWIYGKQRSAFFNSLGVFSKKNPVPIPISVNSVIAGQSYKPVTLAPSDAPTPNATPPLFFWYLINNTLPLMPSTSAVANKGYQIIANPVQTLIPALSPNPLFPQTLITIANVNDVKIPQTFQTFDTGDLQYTIQINSSPVPNPNSGDLVTVGDGEQCIDPTDFNIRMRNSGASNTPIPNFPEFVFPQTRLFAKSGFSFSVIPEYLIFSYNNEKLLTQNLYWYIAVRSNGDFDDNAIYKLSYLNDPNVPLNNLNPYAYSWAMPLTLTPFDPTATFVATSPPPFTYNTIATVISEAQPDNFSNYQMGVFVNPLYSYAYQSMGASYLNVPSTLSTNRFYDNNVPNFTGAGMVNADYAKAIDTAGGWNSGSTFPNNCGMNTPILLVDGETLQPIKRSAVVIVKAGNYTKAEIAVNITRQLVDLQAPSSSINYLPPTDVDAPNFWTQGNYTTLINANCPAELKASAGLGNSNTLYDLTYTYPTTLESGQNPFQCELELGSDLVNAQTFFESPNLFFTPSWTFPNLNPPPSANPQPSAPPLKKILPMSMVMNAVINNNNYKTASGTPLPNIPVCFRPLTTDFRVIGNNVNIFAQDPDLNGATPTVHSWLKVLPADPPDFPLTQIGFTNTFTTSIPFQFQIDDSDYYDFSDDAFQFAYQTGSQDGITPTILPCIITMDSVYQYSAGSWGTNEFSLLYDSTKDQFSFNFLHTPIIANSGGVPSPCVVRSRTTANNPYSAGDILFTENPFNNPSTAPSQLGEKRSDVNERHSGIILTQLKSTTGSVNGTEINFWEKLGFNLNSVVLPEEKYIAKDGTFTPILYADFMTYTTSELYSISQNVNVLNSISTRNNEQMVIRDTFTQWLNQQVVPVVPPAVAPPTPVGFGADVLYASNSATSLVASNPSTSILDELGGNIMLEIVGYGTGSELQDKDAFAVKSIVSLYFLTGNTFLSSPADTYTYYHQSTIPQIISKLRVRILNPITKKKLTSILGENNSIYLTITQNQQISLEGSEQPPSTKKGKKKT